MFSSGSQLLCLKTSHTQAFTFTLGRPVLGSKSRWMSSVSLRRRAKDMRPQNMIGPLLGSYSGGDCLLWTRDSGQTGFVLKDSESTLDQ